MGMTKSNGEKQKDKHIDGMKAIQDRFKRL